MLYSLQLNSVRGYRADLLYGNSYEEDNEHSIVHSNSLNLTYQTAKSEEIKPKIF